jgi:DNA-binding PadR family transcriptional regulator
MVRQPFTIEYALLGFICQHPTHGYEIHRFLNKQDGIGSLWKIKQSQLYALLDKLENSGYLAYVMESQDTYPARKIYHATEFGREEYEKWLDTPVSSPRTIRQDFMAKVYFLLPEDKERLVHLIHRQKEETTAWVERASDGLARSGETIDFNWIMYSYRFRQINIIMAWLDDLLAKIS